MALCHVPTSFLRHVMGESAILFKNVSRHFGDVKAVDNLVCV
jgi:hypothetical protein